MIKSNKGCYTKKWLYRLYSFGPLKSILACSGQILVFRNSENIMLYITWSLWSPVDKTMQITTQMQCTWMQWLNVLSKPDYLSYQNIQWQYPYQTPASLMPSCSKILSACCIIFVLLSCINPLNSICYSKFTEPNAICWPIKHWLLKIEGFNIVTIQGVSKQSLWDEGRITC